MQNADELIEKYKNDMLKMMKRSYFPYEDSVTVTENVPSADEPSVKTVAQGVFNDERPNEPSNDSYGDLKVRVFSGNIAFPIETAFVRIFDDTNNEVREGYTNQSGIFDAKRLPTPNKSISKSPNFEKGYAGYKIIVTHPRFNTEIFENVPVFDGVESIQDVRMRIGNETTEDLTVESEPEDLRRNRNA